MYIIVTKSKLHRALSKLWDAIQTGITPGPHTHTISQVTGLAGRLNKIEKLAKAGL